ncbi:hypothetical protein EVAR_35977_1 [Eumeta japonica]|uniref:Uncharacterized protein n=1 Tax=Eumeta variegata TaxID=151549 RepID=A0A4C1WU73_EUMVA|nr:hypothetical protein EVAR_35977_1 [Eumeta japonica]
MGILPDDSHARSRTRNVNCAHTPRASLKSLLLRNIFTGGALIGTESRALAHRQEITAASSSEMGFRVGTSRVCLSICSFGRNAEAAVRLVMRVALLITPESLITVIYATNRNRYSLVRDQKA